MFCQECGQPYAILVEADKGIQSARLYHTNAETYPAATNHEVVPE